MSTSWLRLAPALLLLACTGQGDGETGKLHTGDTDDSTETGDTSDTSDTGGNGADCATVNAGDDWAWNGECPQMRTPVVITVSDCTLTLDYDAVGGMTMGMPYSGTVSGDQVSFDDGDSVDGCVGTVESADKITGTCDGCEYTLTQKKR